MLLHEFATQCHWHRLSRSCTKSWVSSPPKPTSYRIPLLRRSALTNIEFLSVECRICLVDNNSIYHYLHVTRLPRHRHTPRHRLQQVMKLHWNLESLTQRRTTYEFLVEEHDWDIILSDLTRNPYFVTKWDRPWNSTEIIFELRFFRLYLTHVIT